MTTPVATMHAAERAHTSTTTIALVGLQLVAPLLAAGAILAHGIGRAATSPYTWTSLLADAPVRRLRAAVLVDARDCPASLAVVEWFARPELAGAVGSVTLVVRDGRDSLARYADALLTAPVHLAVVALAPPLRPHARTLGDGPRLALVDPEGRVLWTSRIGDSAEALASLRRTAERVGDHYVHTELATTSTTP